MPKIARARLTRRQFLTAASATAVTFAGGIAKPYVSRAAGRPVITHGIQCGDVSGSSAVIWARADRPARMVVEASTTESFKKIVEARVAEAPAKADFAAKALLRNLPAEQQIFYRVRFEDYSSPALVSEAQIGQFGSAPSSNRDVSFVWSGDSVGQGCRRTSSFAPLARDWRRIARRWIGRCRHSAGLHLQPPVSTSAAPSQDCS